MSLTTVPYEIDIDWLDSGDFTGDGVDVTEPVRNGNAENAKLIAERGNDRGSRYLSPVIGQMIVPLDNRTRDFSLAYEGGAYYDFLQSQHLIRWLMNATEAGMLDLGPEGAIELSPGEVLGLGGGDAFSIFTGKTERFEQRDPYVQKATAVCYGAFKQLDKSISTTQVYPLISVSNALHVICSLCGIPEAKRSIQESSIMLRNWYLYNENGLAAADKLKNNEGPGATWREGRDYSVVFENEASRSTQTRSTTVQENFADTNYRVAVTDYTSGKDEVIDACTVLVEQKEAGPLDVVWKSEGDIVLGAGESVTREIVVSGGFVGAVEPSAVGTNAEQLLMPSAPLTNGSFIANVNGTNTSAIDHDAITSVIQAAFDVAVGAGNTILGGTLATGLRVQFIGALAGRVIPLITITSSLNTGVGPATVHVIYDGDGTDSKYKLVPSEPLASGAFKLKSLNGNKTTSIPFDSVDTVIRTRLEALPLIVPGDVNTSGGPINSTEIGVEFVGALVGTFVPLEVTDSTLTTATASTATINVTETAKGGGPDYTSTAPLIFHLSQTSGGSLELEIQAQTDPVTVSALQLRAQAFSVARNQKVTYPTNLSSLTETERANLRTYTPDMWRDISLETAANKAQVYRQYLGVARPKCVISFKELLANSAAQFQREIADRIHLVNEQLGEDSDFFIEHIRDEWDSKFATSYFSVQKVVDESLMFHL